MPSGSLQFSIPQVSNLFFKFLSYNLQSQSLHTRLESFPNCGKLGNPDNVECIWDCEWVDNPLIGRIPKTGSPLIDQFVSEAGLIYGLIKYPANKSCLDDCTFIAKLKEQENQGIQGIINVLLQSKEILNVKPNIDSIIIEICLIYFELRNQPPCLVLPPFQRSLEKKRKTQRLFGNSLTNSYVDKTLKYTLNQYPWTCSLRTAGYRGRHVCGATLLSAPPSKTIIVGAAHCNYICKSSDGTIRETCCCRDPKDNFASCRNVGHLFFL